LDDSRFVGNPEVGMGLSLTSEQAVAREQSDCSLAKTNSIIYITVLSGTSRKPRRSFYKRAHRT
jgi:hypothetical protein